MAREISRFVRQREADALTLAENCLGILKPEERGDAERLLELCRLSWSEGDTYQMTGGPGTVAREAGRLVEYLARRSASAMPYAALGRALLADLQGATRDKERLIDEFTMKVALLGL